jgi:hypothetical protein
MKKSLLLLFALFAGTIGCAARPEKFLSRDSIAAHRIATMHHYELLLAQLVQGESRPLPDSLAIPCPYYYKMIARPTLYAEPVHDAMAIGWQPQHFSRTDLLPPLGGAGTADSELLLNQAINQSLVAQYILHPYLFTQTQSDLMKAATLRSDVSAPIVSNVKLTEKVKTPEDTPQVGEIHIVPHRPNFWSFGGNYSTQFTQVYYTDNWYKGGENYNSLQASMTMDANYNNKQKLQWDNKLELRLGFQDSHSDKLHKFKTNSDLIRLTNKIGLQASTHWYYTFQSQAYTQFYRGYKSNDAKVYSDFMSPFNLVLSIGMDYKLSKKRFSCSATLSPLAYNFRYCDRLALSTKYGLKARHSTYNHFGPNITANWTWRLTDNLQWTSRVYWFSDLSSNDIEWENTISCKIGKFLSTKIFVYPRIDDSSTNYKNEHGKYFMLQELFSLGFDYSF